MNKYLDRRGRGLLIFTVCCFCFLGAGFWGIREALAGPAMPFPVHRSYAPGTIRPDSESRERQDAVVREFYDRWKADYLVRVPGESAWGGPLYRITHGSVDPERTVSEGQGYGMLILTHMAGHDPRAQEIFNGLWAFARRHPSHVDTRLMAWEVPENPETGIDAAFDGDADMAQALLLAHSQWGSSGRVEYLREAKILLGAIQESMIGRTSRLPLLGDWVAGAGPPYGQYTPRSSDFMPSHFRSWYRLTGNPAWLEVLDAVQSAVSRFQAEQSPASGLLPDFLVPRSESDHRLQPAPAYFLEGPHDGHYEYNAGRVPWRIGTDALLNNDPVSLAQSRKIADWIYASTQGRATRIRAGYYLDGTPLDPESDFTTFFAAPFGVAVMTRPGQQHFLNAIYNSIKQRHEDYYEDSVTLLCLLVMTGNYWEPAPTPISPPAKTTPPLFSGHQLLLLKEGRNLVK